MDGQDYRRIADAVAAEIADGRLRPGDRLHPQRRFARRRGIAGSTAARVYRELARRGLVVGEVGRGTFVRAAAPPPEPALAEPGGALVDLELTFATLPDQPALLAEGLGRMLRPDVLERALRPVGAAGTPAARDAAAALLDCPEWTPQPADILFAAGGRQAIAAAIATLVPPGERLGVEALTYPVVKALAARLGVTLVPIETDEEGLVPDALRAAHRSAPLRAVYVQPTLHNPLGCTMSARRRAELAESLAAHGVPAIEDRVYSFLADTQPLASFAPEHTVVVDSLSKRLAPGLTAGFLVPPRRLADRIAVAVRSGGLAAGGFALHAATGWIADGTVERIVRAKRADAEHRQALVADRLASFAIRAGARTIAGGNCPSRGVRRRSSPRRRAEGSHSLRRPRSPPEAGTRPTRSGSHWPPHQRPRWPGHSTCSPRSRAGCRKIPEWIDPRSSGAGPLPGAAPDGTLGEA